MESGPVTDGLEQVEFADRAGGETDKVNNSAKPRCRNGICYRLASSDIERDVCANAVSCLAYISWPRRRVARSQDQISAKRLQRLDMAIMAQHCNRPRPSGFCKLDGGGRNRTAPLDKQGLSGMDGAAAIKCTPCRGARDRERGRLSRAQVAGSPNRLLLMQTHQLRQDTVGWPAEPSATAVHSNWAVTPIRQKGGADQIADPKPRDGFPDGDDVAGSVREALEAAIRRYDNGRGPSRDRGN